MKGIGIQLLQALDTGAIKNGASTPTHELNERMKETVIQLLHALDTVSIH
jgi:hypothetical protein